MVHDDDPTSLSEIFGKMRLTVLAGPNGSGKSTMLGLLSKIFHNIERYHDRIPAKFSIKYDLEVGGQTTRIQLRANEKKKIFVQLDDGSERLLQPVVRPKKSREKFVQSEVAEDKMRQLATDKERRNGLPAASILYDELRPLLPKKVILSAFNTRDEYPSLRPNSYIGDRSVLLYDTSSLYARNLFGLPRISTGLTILGEVLSGDSSKAKVIDEMLGLKFTGKVKIRGTDYQEEERWTTLTSKISKREHSGDIYINDLQFTRNGKLLSLRSMSSGEKMLILRLASIMASIEDDCVVVIEEPELHLDPAWTHQIVSLLLTFFCDYRCHFLVATHSWSLINSVPRAWLLLFERGKVQQCFSKTEFAIESELSRSLYRSKDNLSEDFLKQKIPTLSRRQLRDLFSELGDSPMRYRVFQQLQRADAEDETAGAP